MKELIRVRVQYASRQQCCKTHKRPLPFVPLARYIIHGIVILINCNYRLFVLERFIMHCSKGLAGSVPVSALSEAWVCSHLLVGIAGSNIAGGPDVVNVVCCQRSLLRADHSSIGVLPSVVCLSK